MKGHTRWRGQSIEVRVYAGKGKTVTKTVRWQGSKKATANAADAVLRKLLDDFDAGADGGLSVTVRQLVKRWWAQHAHEWSPTTRAARDSYLRLHVLPALGDRKVRLVTTADVDDLYVALRAKGLSPSTIRRSVHSMLVNIFSDAVRWRWIASNPVSDAAPPKRGRDLPEVQPPTDDEVRALLDLAAETNLDLLAFLAAAADTGARRGEVCAFRWSKVDLDAREVLIDRGVVLDDDGRLIEKPPKNGKARRISIGEPCAVILREHRRRVLERAMALGVRVAPDGFVFSQDAAGSTPWRPDGATARFMKLRDRADLKRVRLHDLRHALVTQWLAEGVDSTTVRERVGHADLSILSRYAHLVPAKDREAADRLGSRLSPGKTGT